MPKKKLTHPFITNLEIPKKRTEYYDTVVNGLLLRVTKTGHKAFALAYGTKGKRYTIGTFPSVGLAEARDVAKKLKIEIALGNDPQAEKVANRNKPKAKTVADLAKVFEKKHFPTLRQSTRDDYKRRINNTIIPKLGKIPLETITRLDIIELLEEIAEDNNAPVNSNRIRSILSSLFSFGVNRGMLDHNIVLSIKPLGKASTRKRYYTPEEIVSIWDAFELEEEPYRSLFKMLLICGQRSGETRQTRWDHIQKGVWTIPAELTKANRTHEVPLPFMALEVLRDVKNYSWDSDYIFKSPVLDNEPVDWLQKAAGRVRRASKVEDFRLHDLRRTAATYMAGMRTDRTVLGKILNHKGLAGDDQVTAIYDRYNYREEKKTALTKWNTKLNKILRGEVKSTNLLKMSS
jgi:integrase